MLPLRACRNGQTVERGWGGPGMSARCTRSIHGENGKGGPESAPYHPYRRLQPRSPPPLPPPRLPPPKLDSRGLASLTLIFLLLTSVSLNCCIALEASSAFAISTKPKPLD